MLSAPSAPQTKHTFVLHKGAADLTFRKTTLPGGQSWSVGKSLVQKGLRRALNDETLTGLTAILIPLLEDPTHRGAQALFTNLINRLCACSAEDFSDLAILPEFVRMEKAAKAAWAAHCAAPSTEHTIEIGKIFIHFAQVLNASTKRSRIESHLKSAVGAPCLNVSLEDLPHYVALQASIRGAFDLPPRASVPMTVETAVDAIGACETPLESSATTAEFLRVFDGLNLGDLLPTKQWWSSKRTLKDLFKRIRAHTSAEKRPIVDALQVMAVGRSHREVPLYLQKAITIQHRAYKVEPLPEIPVPADADVIAALSEGGPAWSTFPAWAFDKHTAEGRKKGASSTGFAFEGALVDPTKSLPAHPGLVRAYMITKPYLDANHGVGTAPVPSVDDVRTVAKAVFEYGVPVEGLIPFVPKKRRTKKNRAKKVKNPAPLKRVRTEE